ncbi:hypothetical protein Acr_28g0005650 [Actinidia rufa]|uniref:Retrotransposon Copia-like N-terminal domain-containing protein n=1 Tax=Actinidia rufa TaxID=165716 RepID=A0A7J0H9R0_9ERIC|nr:hypothetical protein Acr_28g0005650 [Actinidia rufa]
MDRSKAFRPIVITLEGPNYIPWSQAISSFLKGRKLWRYITGDIEAPVQGVTETPTQYIKWLEEWDKTGTLIDYQCLLASDLFYMRPADSVRAYVASLLHRNPLHTLEQAISELLSAETRLGLILTSHVDTALATPTPSSRGCGSSGGSRGFSTSGSGSQHNE